MGKEEGTITIKEGIKLIKEGWEKMIMIIKEKWEIFIIIIILLLLFLVILRFTVYNCYKCNINIKDLLDGEQLYEISGNKGPNIVKLSRTKEYLENCGFNNIHWLDHDEGPRGPPLIFPHDKEHYYNEQENKLTIQFRGEMNPHSCWLGKIFNF